MKLVTYKTEGELRPGIWVNGSIVDAGAAAREAGFWSEDNQNGAHEDLASSRRVLSIDGERRQALEVAAKKLLSRGDDGAYGVFTVEDVVLGPPVPDPEKIICLGLNYREHAAEASLEAPPAPMLFAKFRNSLVGQGAPIVIPRASEKVDYEGELAVVIGKRCKEITEEDALEYVAGYMAFNDVSARDLQLQTSQWMAGKAIDTFAPCGPALVSADEIEDVQDLELRTRVNGETVQQMNTSMMIFSVRETIAFISKLMTLEPGDIIATGTPSGVGFKRNPPLLLGEGDVVEVEIEDLGVLHNPVVGPDGLGREKEARSAYAEQKDA